MKLSDLAKRVPGVKDDTDAVDGDAEELR
jgi:hypothetical protein